ncbi:type VII secretion integral membrane protein EccD [Bailinhaonella thermotolerans]|uniref:Type VII secretion integral membrane protein EccD n=1 Tax=Bailinhaonella thermotolerans TaxID=1070861 RepID=A0A3A4B7F3_9ACTN|nr:type VII secretion integral membrane protein EccD [Bailinhaonella thermotolerans]RJL30028.1 type VII secretion integral membrane protein EccD [Bailinhaonella thermotolerans]
MSQLAHISHVSHASLCRVTFVTPRKRIDLALPSDVPLTHMLPTLLRATHDADGEIPPNGWVIQRVAGPPLDLGATLAALQVLDGEVLRLVPRGSEAPAAAFDDVADVIASGVRERTTRWSAHHTRRTGLVAGSALLVAGSLLPVFSGPPWTPAAIASAVAAALLVTWGAVVSRAAGDSPGGAIVGYAALPYAFLAGFFAPAAAAPLDGMGAPHALAGFSAVTLTATVAGFTIVEGMANFIGFALAGFTGAAAALAALTLDVSGAGTAAVAAALVLALAPLIPVVSFRMARLPLPALPANAEELRADDQEVDAPQVADRAAEADRYATGLVAGIALVALGGQAALAVEGGWAAIAMSVACGLALVLRARVFEGFGQRVWLIAAGLAGLALPVVVAAARADGPVPVLVLMLALFWGAVLTVALGVWLPEWKPTPFWGRAGDILEFIVIVSLFPLAMAVLDLYAIVRGLAG